MPKGYIIGHITVKDAAAYQEYIVRDTPLLAAAGAKPLIRGGTSESVEGPEFARHVVFEFADYAAARAFYNSPDYQEVMKIRQATAESMMVLVEGV